MNSTKLSKELRGAYDRLRDAKDRHAAECAKLLRVGDEAYHYKGSRDGVCVEILGVLGERIRVRNLITGNEYVLDAYHFIEPQS